MEAGLDGPPAQVAEAGVFQVQEQPGKLIETSQKVKKKKKRVKNTLLNFFIVLYSTVLRINVHMCF